MINFKAKSETEADIFIYGDIGESFWNEDTVTAKKFAMDLKAIGNVSMLNIFINSGGGNVFDAQAIYSMLKRHNANKTVYIDGLAASAASVIAMAGDKIMMPKNAMMMIHCASACVCGNSMEIHKMGDTLTQVDISICEVYEAKTMKKKEEMMSMLEAETWMTAKEAVEMGFADEMEEEKMIAASIDFNFLNFGNVKIDTKTFKNFSPDKIVIYREEPIPLEPVINILKDQGKDFFRIKNKLLGGTT